MEWLDCPIVSLHVWGDILEDLPNFEVHSTVFVVTEPAEKLPWMCNRPDYDNSFPKMLRIANKPISWVWRPAEWPAWNHEITRTACVWTAANGADEAVIQALGERPFDRIQLDGPASSDELVRQLRLELPVSRRHLVEVTQRYDDERP